MMNAIYNYGYLPKDAQGNMKNTATCKPYFLDPGMASEFPRSDLPRVPHQFPAIFRPRGSGRAFSQQFPFQTTTAAVPNTFLCTPLGMSQSDAYNSHVNHSLAQDQGSGSRFPINSQDQGSGSRFPINSQDQGSGSRFPINSQDQGSGSRFPINSQDQGSGSRFPINSQDQGSGSRFPINSQDQGSGSRFPINSQDQGSGSRFPINSQDQGSGSRFPINSQDQGSGSRFPINSQYQGSGSRFPINSQDQGSGSRFPINSQDQGSGSRFPINSQDQGSGSRFPINSQDHGSGSRIPINSQGHGSGSQFPFNSFARRTFNETYSNLQQMIQNLRGPAFSSRVNDERLFQQYYQTGNEFQKDLRCMDRSTLTGVMRRDGFPTSLGNHAQSDKLVHSSCLSNAMQNNIRSRYDAMRSDQNKNGYLTMYYGGSTPHDQYTLSKNYGATRFEQNQFTQSCDYHSENINSPLNLSISSAKMELTKTPLVSCAEKRKLVTRRKKRCLRVRLKSKQPYTTENSEAACDSHLPTGSNCSAEKDVDVMQSAYLSMSESNTNSCNTAAPPAPDDSAVNHRQCNDSFTITVGSEVETSEYVTDIHLGISQNMPLNSSNTQVVVCHDKDTYKREPNAIADGINDRQSHLCEPNAITDGVNDRQSHLCEPNAITDGVNDRQSHLCEPNVITDGVNDRQSHLCEPSKDGLNNTKSGKTDSSLGKIACGQEQNREGCVQSNKLVEDSTEKEKETSYGNITGASFCGFDSICMESRVRSDDCCIAISSEQEQTPIKEENVHFSEPVLVNLNQEEETEPITCTSFTPSFPEARTTIGSSLISGLCSPEFELCNNVDSDNRCSEKNTPKENAENRNQHKEKQNYKSDCQLPSCNSKVLRSELSQNKTNIVVNQKQLESMETSFHSVPTMLQHKIIKRSFQHLNSSHIDKRPFENSNEDTLPLVPKKACTSLNAPVRILDHLHKSIRATDPYKDEITVLKNADYSEKNLIKNSRSIDASMTITSASGAGVTSNTGEINTSMTDNDALVTGATNTGVINISMTDNDATNTGVIKISMTDNDALVTGATNTGVIKTSMTDNDALVTGATNTGVIKISMTDNDALVTGATNTGVIKISMTDNDALVTGATNTGAIKTSMTDNDVLVTDATNTEVTYIVTNTNVTGASVTDSSITDTGVTYVVTSSNTGLQCIVFDADDTNIGDTHIDTDETDTRMVYIDTDADVTDSGVIYIDTDTDVIDTDNDTTDTGTSDTGTEIYSVCKTSAPKSRETLLPKAATLEPRFTLVPSIRQEQSLPLLVHKCTKISEANHKSSPTDFHRTCTSVYGRKIESQTRVDCVAIQDKSEDTVQLNKKQKEADVSEINRILKKTVGVSCVVGADEQTSQNSQTSKVLDESFPQSHKSGISEKIKASAVDRCTKQKRTVENVCSDKMSQESVPLFSKVKTTVVDNNKHFMCSYCRLIFASAEYWLKHMTKHKYPAQTHNLQTSIVNVNVEQSQTKRIRGKTNTVHLKENGK